MASTRFAASAALLTSVIVLSAAAPSCARVVPRTSSAELTIGGSSSEVDSVGIAGGFLHVSEGLPGISCGTIKRGPGDPELSFVVLLAFESTGVSSIFTLDHASSSRHTDHEMEATSEISLAGIDLETEHSATLSEDGRTITSERLVIQGVEVDPSKGRVFLLRGDDPTGELVQVEAELPAALDPDGDWGPFLKKLAGDLQAANAEIAAFLED